MDEILDLLNISSDSSDISELNDSIKICSNTDAGKKTECEVKHFAEDEITQTLCISFDESIEFKDIELKNMESKSQLAENGMSK